MKRLDYKSVSAWLNRQGLLAELCLAQRHISAASAIDLAKNIVGPYVDVRVRRVRGSWAYTDRAITLATHDRKTVRLASVLHECAHVIDFRKGPRLRSCHGESFCRTYARLLKDYADFGGGLL